MVAVKLRTVYKSLQFAQTVQTVETYSYIFFAFNTQLYLKCTNLPGYLLSPWWLLHIGIPRLRSNDKVRKTSTSYSKQNPRTSRRRSVSLLTHAIMQHVGIQHFRQADALHVCFLLAVAWLV